MQHPYSCDCNYFLNPVNDVGVPTIEYIWENYDDIGENGDEVVKTDKQVVEWGGVKQMNIKLYRLLKQLTNIL